MEANYETMDFDAQLPATREFQEYDVERLHEVGRCYVATDYINNHHQIALICKPAGNADDIYQGGVHMSVGSVHLSMIKQPGKKPDKRVFEITVRQFNIIRHMDAPEFENEEGLEDQDYYNSDLGQRALDFACKFALSCFGSSRNMAIDLKHTPPPTIFDLRDVLIEFGLVDPDKLPRPRRERPTQTHGGRGKNAMSPKEAEKLGISHGG